MPTKKTSKYFLTRAPSEGVFLFGFPGCVNMIHSPHVAPFCRADPLPRDHNNNDLPLRTPSQPFPMRKQQSTAALDLRPPCAETCIFLNNGLKMAK